MERELKDTGLETAVLTGAGGAQVGDTLRVLLPMTDEGRPALMDFMAATIGEGADVLQYYTTLTMELPDKGREELIKAVPVFNFYCPLGSFGIFNGHQLYHKYSLLLKEEGAEAIAADVLDCMTLLYDMLDEYYPLLMELAEGNVTLDETVEKGLLQPV